MSIDSFDYNKFANSLQKARYYAANFKYMCCCPECHEAAIKSHLLQRHPVLEALTGDKNELMQFEDNWEDARSGRWDLFTKKTRGINDAMQYRLFCGKHDSFLFKNIESRNIIPESKRDCLLLAYRGACSARHQEERRMHLFESNFEHDPNEFNDAWLKNSLGFIRRMDAVIDNLWEALCGKDDSYTFRMIAMPYIPVAASDCIVDEEDYQDHIMEETYCKPLNCYFVNLIPNNNRLLLLLGCDTRYGRKGEYNSIVTDFPANCDLPYQYFIETLWGILLKCHNRCCSPKLAEDSKWKELFDNYERMKVNDILK